MLKYVLFLCLCAFLIVSPSAFAAIHISEIYPVPEVGNYEWVEIVNTASSSVNLQGYVLRDKALHTLLLPHIILEEGQFVIATSSGVLNNSGDTVELVLDGNILESVTYPTGLSILESYTLCGDQWMIIDSISPGFDTVACLENQPTPEETEIVDVSLPTAKPLPTLQSRSQSLTPTPKQAKNIVEATDEPAKKSVQSFTNKHAPHSTPTSPQQKPSPTSLVINFNKNVPSVSPQKSATSQTSLYFMCTVIGAYSIALCGLILYKVMKKRRKNTYNQLYDS